MIRLLTVLFLTYLIQVAPVTGQTSPDFTVTDSRGNTHQLYADYLDQGKTVMVKVFYVACPPCNAIAPHLEPLYQKWGGGEADVQFIELSILQTDTDAKINVYKDNHHTTFPAAGGEGGSVPAVQPFKDGTFGVYSGTPTFVVIAPDRTVNYDVSGLNIQGTIDALDAAIAATGATGMNTSTSEPEKKLPVTLISNITSETLVLNYTGEETFLEATIISMDGKVYTSVRFPAVTNNPVRLNVSDLTTGQWVLQVKDTSSGIMAPYLFVKN